MFKPLSNFVYIMLHVRTSSNDLKLDHIANNIPLPYHADIAKSQHRCLLEDKPIVTLQRPVISKMCITV